MHNGLAAALDGKKLRIQFDPNKHSSFSIDGTGISLNTNARSNNLFHEMWHAYQAYRETPVSFSQSTINLEIEASYAQYLYVKSLPEYISQSEWYKRYNDTKLGIGIRLIENHVDYKGNLLTDEMNLYNVLGGVERLFREIPAYSNYTYDYDRSAISNFINLKNLSHSCN